SPNCRLPRAPIMAQHRHIHDLADELLSEILSFLLESRPRALNGNSFGNGLNGHHHEDHQSYRPVKYGEACDLDRFRLVCRRFMRIGTPRKFSRFILRFSEDGFRRLDDLLNMQLAYYVKTVTYLVRPLYHGSGWIPILRALDTQNPNLARLHSRRLREQNALIDTNHDLTQLRSAITAFSSLQEIKLLRLQDEADERLLDFIRDDHAATTVITATSSTPHFDWEYACSRAVTNLGIALLNSQCSSLRFIGPQISPEATLQLLRAPSTTLAAMGTRLTSLDINFYSHSDITPTMATLSPVFHAFFAEAANLAALHIGFPPKAPLDLPLDALLPPSSSPRKALRTLSLQGWRLSADELISLARRHPGLRTFRLVAVYLRPRGRWRDVLAVLRDELVRLERLHLCDIGYAAHFDAEAGVEVFDPMPASAVSVAAGTTAVPMDQASTAVAGSGRGGAGAAGGDGEGPRIGCGGVGG
ncbi:hypothetical protein N7462_008430, partial [Penicillium macrosclerotiorum]|uniref:uncharacterized protein n=1 Tax=Penicillium macrosclerotiorum TaxID=303699 RepID=UPI0025474FE3